MESERILIVDDEPNIRKTLSDIFADEGYAVEGAEDAEGAMAALAAAEVSLVVLDVWLTGVNGLELLAKIKARQPDLPVIMVSGHANVDMAVKALKTGAYDFMEKPLSSDRTLALARNALESYRLKRENLALRQGLGLGRRLVGGSAAMANVQRLIQQAARSDAPVFIQGENGTGKELVAREIHALGARGARSFVAINCAAIPESLIESELFGHEKGSFTGAMSQKRGRFELAHQGTLFLDEIVDLSLPAQAKVLRALQEQQFERVGGLASIKVNVRLVSASNKDPHQAMAEKSFREDLFYRLHVLPIHVPPLRERADDIPALVDHFLEEAARDNNLAVLPEIADEAVALLMGQPWPGNVRQLRNIVQRLLVLNLDDRIDAAAVRAALAADSPSAAVEVAGGDDIGETWEAVKKMQYSDARDHFERFFIFHKLRENEYNVARTAQALGMYASNLHAKIKKFGIQLER